MKYLISENQYRLIVESPSNSLGPFIRGQLKQMYVGTSDWGKAPNPDDDCDTDEGVLNVFPHSSKDVWSILNRFDTNMRVERKMREIFNNKNPTNNGDSDFKNWIKDNREDLFRKEGKYTQQLINLNINTINQGNENEEYAVTILGKKNKDAKIVRYCSGDRRDRNDGIDILFKRGDTEVTLQVKPFKTITKGVNPIKGTYFDVEGPTFPIERYKQHKVNFFMFVKPNEGYIFFPNKHENMKKLGKENEITRFFVNDDVEWKNFKI
jgi:hypothetical protein